MLHKRTWDTLQSNGLLLASEGACLIHTLQPWMRNGGERNVHHSPMMLSTTFSLHWSNGSRRMLRQNVLLRFAIITIVLRRVSRLRGPFARYAPYGFLLVIYTDSEYKPNHSGLQVHVIFLVTRTSLIASLVYKEA